MAPIDLLLNLAGLLIWLNWRALRFDPLAKTYPATLVGTLRRAEPRRLRGWPLIAGLVLMLLLRAVLYWEIGSPVNWVPTINLGVVVLPFRSELFPRAVFFSVLSFGRVLLLFYFWILMLGLINPYGTDPDPIQRLLRLHLGFVGRWPRSIQLVAPLLVVTGLWAAIYPAGVSLGVLERAAAFRVVLEQGLILGISVYFEIKYLLVLFLLLYLLNSYIYLGPNPVWDFVTLTGSNLCKGLRQLPCRAGKLDLAPIAALCLTILALESMPRLVLGKLAARHLSLWPQ